jgi:antitoxin MazE
MVEDDSMRVTVSKWGNSLGLRIPRGLAEDAQLADGSTVDLRVESGRLIVERLDELEDLLAQVRPENIHGDAFAATPVGNEAL